MALKVTTYVSGSKVSKLPGSSTFHSTALFHIYEATPAYAPILITLSQDGKIIAKLLAVIRKSTRLFPPSLIKRCEVYGTGEYFDNSFDKEALFEIMLQRLTQEALQHCFLIEFRNLTHNMECYKVFSSNDYFPINWLRVRHSLHHTAPIEERFSASRIRQIKKGLSNGAEVREAQTSEEIEQFAKMLHRVYSLKVRRHFPSIDFFHQLVKHLMNKHLCKIFIVTYKRKVIGGSACIYSERTAYLWFSGGMRKAYLRQYPGILAVWKALNDAKQQGYEHMEFMDVGLPFKKHGYREFVLRFGGKQLSTRRWFRFRWTWLNKLLSSFYK